MRFPNVHRDISFEIFFWCTKQIMKLHSLGINSFAFHSCKTTIQKIGEELRRENGKNVGRIAFSRNMQWPNPPPSLPFFCVTLGLKPLKKNLLVLNSTYMIIFILASTLSAYYALSWSVNCRKFFANLFELCCLHIHTTVVCISNFTPSVAKQVRFAVGWDKIKISLMAQLKGLTAKFKLM